ncbi:MAG: hypothetical protein H0X28_11185 [Solirubrobacterales bacterium]|nr:hypothetical protein [Solirubrobacterales bacterium]
MAETLPRASDLFSQPTYLPRVTRRDGRAIEDALAGPTLFDSGVKLDAAVVEATYAVEDSPLLKRLRESGVPQLVDPQTLRFTGKRFLTVAQFERVPYRPATRITADSFTPSDADALAREVMLFEQHAGASWYLAAALPYYDQDLQSWLRHNDRLLAASCAANGATDLDRKPLIAQVAPGRRLLAQPELVINRLLDHPVSAVDVQPLTLDPIKDSIEKLVQYAHFLRAIGDAGLPVIASRVGAFGLVLSALGVAAFDSGLAQAETCNLASLNRAPSQRELEGGGKTGGSGRRIYLEQLKTTLSESHATAIIENRALRSHVACPLGCCRHRGFENLAQRGRQHYLWVRDHEVDLLRKRPSEGMRADLVYEQLRTAREIGAVVTRTLRADAVEAPSFEHIDRWIAVLARETMLAAAA